MLWKFEWYIFDKKYEKLTIESPTEEMWLALDKEKESLGKENLNKMLIAFVRTVLQTFLKDETNEEIKIKLNLN